MIVENLTVAYGPDWRNSVVRGVDLRLQPGKIVALVGESGCGKTTLARTLMGIPPRGARIIDGSVILDGTDLFDLSNRDLRDLWGERVAYIGQDPSSALNPTRRIGRQIQDPIRRHSRKHGNANTTRLTELLELVGLKDLHAIERRFPKELSGGQRQRVGIAAALACDPDVLILDEPTTGLDVLTQARLVELLQNVIEKLGISVLWVSHDLALMSQIAMQIVVMYAGQIVENGPAGDICSDPQHPYTRALIAATPSMRRSGLSDGIRGQVPDVFDEGSCSFVTRCDFAKDICRTQPIQLRVERTGHEVRCVRLGEIPLLPSARDVEEPRLKETPTHENPVLQMSGMVFTYPGAPAATLQDVDVVLGRSEILGIVGESGSGKSTLLRVITGMTPSDSGEIRLDGELLPPEIKSRTNSQKREIQLIFQHAETALNPKHNVAQILARPVRLASNASNTEVHLRIRELLDRVKLSPNLLERYPRELSGGQRQRLAIARSLGVGPRVLLCDEISSALDVSVQAAILTLVRQLVDEEGLSAVFVSHNLAAVKTVCDRTAVMSLGKIVEERSSESLWADPQHEYTKNLIEATPVLRSR